MKNYGNCVTPEGEKEIIDFIQTENIHGRQWTFVLLSDESVVMKIKSQPDGGFETVEQTMRLTKKSIALLQLVLVQANMQFKLQMEALLDEMIKGKDVNIKLPKSNG